MAVIKGGISAHSSIVTGKINSSNNINGSIAQPKTIYVEELEFKTYFEFPNIGEKNKIYIATDENAVYRFDENTLTYYAIGRDYNEINIIQSCL